MYICLITGRGGASIYGKEFADEITNELKHTGKILLIQVMQTFCRTRNKTTYTHYLTKRN